MDMPEDRKIMMVMLDLAMESARLAAAFTQKQEAVDMDSPLALFEQIENSLEYLNTLKAAAQPLRELIELKLKETEDEKVAEIVGDIDLGLEDFLKSLGNGPEGQ